MAIEPRESVMEHRIRVRIGNEQVHYMNGLAAGALVLQLFGDTGGCLSIRREGIGGGLVGYDSVDIFYPVHVGDLVEVVARNIRVGNTSRQTEYHAYLLLSRYDESGAQQARWREFDPPMLVAHGIGTSVIAKENQFGGPVLVDSTSRNERSEEKIARKKSRLQPEA